VDAAPHKNVHATCEFGGIERLRFVAKSMKSQRYRRLMLFGNFACALHATLGAFA